MLLDKENKFLETIFWKNISFILDSIAGETEGSCHHPVSGYTGALWREAMGVAGMSEGIPSGNKATKAKISNMLVERSLEK